MVVWEQGHEIAVRDTIDLKQLLELEDLVSSVKICETVKCEDAVDASPCDTKVVISEDRCIDTSLTAAITDTKTVVCEENIGNSKVSSNGDTMLHDNSKDHKDSSSPAKGTTVTHQTPKKQPKPNKKNKAKGKKQTYNQVEDMEDTSSSSDDTITLDQALFATKVSKSSKSISLDFRLSRGIAQVF